MGNPDGALSKELSTPDQLVIDLEEAIKLAIDSLNGYGLNWQYTMQAHQVQVPPSILNTMPIDLGDQSTEDYRAQALNRASVMSDLKNSVRGSIVRLLNSDVKIEEAILAIQRYFGDDELSKFWQDLLKEFQREATVTES